jgi:UDP-GlcNAc:undecaprenyl-phosphate GlcNAc-1-phosphate transferase
MWNLPVIAFVLAFALTLAFTPLVRKLAFRFGAVAVPRERDVHKEPLPRWGGLAMVAAFLITLGVSYGWVLYRNASHHYPSPWDHEHLIKFIGIVLAALLITIVGAIDDKWEVSAAWQSLALIAAGVILVAFGIRIEGISDPFHSPAPAAGPHGAHPMIMFQYWPSVIGTIIWVFGVAKTVDFIDGLDGLAAGVCGICALTLAFMSAQSGQYGVTIMAAALVGVCAGFLRYNFNPASIIMGTVGAQFLGFVLAAISIVGTLKIAASVSVALPLIVLGIPIFDGLRVVTLRLIKRTPAYMPDKTSHIHHRLINRGYSQKKAVLLIYTYTAGWCFLAIVLLRLVH